MLALGGNRTLEEQPCRSKPSAGPEHGAPASQTVRMTRLSLSTAGRRAPWLLLGTPLLVLGTTLLWLPPALDQASLIGWYVTQLSPLACCLVITPLLDEAWYALCHFLP